MLRWLLNSLGSSVHRCYLKIVYHEWISLFHIVCCIFSSCSVHHVMGHSGSYSMLHFYHSIGYSGQWPCMGQSWSYSLLHSNLSISYPVQCTMYGTILIILFVTFLPQCLWSSSVTMYGTILIIFFVAFLPQYLRSSSVHHVWDNLDHTHCCILTSVSAIQLSAPCMGQS